MIWLTVWTCEHDHIVCGMAWDEDFNQREEIIEIIADAFAQQIFNPWCGICGSGAFTIHDEPTEALTVDELRPALAAAQANQMKLREMLWTLGLAKEPPLEP